MATTHIEIEDAEQQLEVLVEALASGRLSEVILCRHGIPAARLVNPIADASLAGE